MSNPDNLCTIFVNNLPWSVDDNFLKETFAKNGEITDCYVALRGRKSRGFGYVTFGTAAAATSALSVNGTMLKGPDDEEGRECAVVIATPRSPEAEAAAKARVAERAANPPPAKGEKKEGEKKKGGKGEKKKAAKGGKGGRGEGDEKPTPKEKGEKSDKNAKKDRPKPLTWNVGEDHMEFLKSSAEKYEIKGLNNVMKKLMAFAAADEDNEVFAKAPERPAKFFRLKYTPSESEAALLAKADKDFSYDNRHLAVQALIGYVMPSATADPAEKAGSEQMIKDILTKE